MRVVVDDLAFLESDAIVRPATARLDPTTAALRRIEQMGGPAFRDRLVVQRDLPVGAAVVTGAGGDLPAEFVIHAIIQSDQEPVSHHGVARAWRSALERAQEWEFPRLSAPPLGIGAGNLTIEDAADIMVGGLTVHFAWAQFPTELSLVVETEEQRQVFEAALRRSSRQA
jgi:O-acetyl-ADP-ribose deacetylase (regulator of RNase III)